MSIHHDLRRTATRAMMVVALFAAVIARAEPRSLAKADAGPGGAATEINGLVYHDYNNDGLRTVTTNALGADTNEIGIAGVTVTAFDRAGAVASRAQTNAGGAYTLTGLTAAGRYRVEFSAWPADMHPAFHGSSGSVARASSGSSVQFVVAGSRNVSFGLLTPCDMCQRTPWIIANYYMNGDPLAAGSAAQGYSLLAIPYTATGTLKDNAIVVRGALMGATSGLAYQRQSQTVFAAPVMKRHVGLGVLGLNGIYSISINFSGGITASKVQPWLDLSTLGIDAGSSPRPSGALPGDYNTANYDAEVFNVVGKIGLGDLELSEDGETLWAVNMHKRELIELRIGVPARTPTAADVTIHPLPRPACNNGEYRPWGAKYYRGAVYVGGVCSGEYAGATAADLFAFVHAYEVGAPTGAFREVLKFALNYPRTFVSPGSSARWRPWLRDWYDISPLKDPGAFDQTIYPHPILADIEFADDGGMLLGFLDRMAHLGGNYNHGTRRTDPAYYDIASGGDLLKACLVNGVYVLEQNGKCGGVATQGVNTGAGPGGGEYFFDDHWSNVHTEVSLGGLTVMPGRREVVTTGYDVLEGGRVSGLTWMRTDTGAKTRGYEVTPADFISKSVTMGKASGLGDLEVLCDPPPTEIGNRVWSDVDGDGVQDADEAGIPNVKVRLFEVLPTTKLAASAADADAALALRAIATTTTAADGSYYFDLARVAPSLSRVAGRQVIVRIALDDPALPRGYSVTRQNAGGHADNAESRDVRDSDSGNSGAASGPASAGQSTDIAFVTGGMGVSNHTLDFGFMPVSALGNYVWFDDNDDGRQNEPPARGVNGVRLNLLDASGAVISTTVTASDASGNPGYYLFDALSAGTYQVVCDWSTLPVTSTLTLTDQGGDDTLDSDAAPVSCAIPPVTLAPLERNMTLDIGLVRAGALGNYIWRDINRDGVQNEPPEQGVNGVTVNLLDASGQVLSSTVTTPDPLGRSGYYTFTRLPASTYRVSCDLATLPPGWSLTQPLVGDPALDSDVDSACVTRQVTLARGEINPTVDIGLHPPSGLGDYVWVDLDGDGRQQASEPPYARVRVSLRASAAVLSSTITDANGYYEFLNLPPNTPYQVCFELPPGGVWTVQGPDPAAPDDSNAGPDGCTAPVTLAPLEFNPTIDAGVIPKVVVEKRATGSGNFGTLGVDGALTYTIVLHNPTIWTLADITVVDPLQPRLRYVPDSATPPPLSTMPLTWRIPQIAPAGAVTITFRALADISGSLLITNTVVVTQGGKPTAVTTSGTPFNPTAIGLSTFDVRIKAVGAQIRWTTAFERDTLGFNVYRGASPTDAGSVRVNAVQIAARSSAGAAYAIDDAGGAAGDLYWLEEVEVSGRSTVYGPSTVPPCETCAHASTLVTPRRVFLPWAAAAE